jgi:glycosyltransferase involved in cell wall biosynthesis
MTRTSDSLRRVSPRRVLFLDHTAQMGGGEVALVRLASSLDRHRYCPIVLLFSDGPLVGQLRSAGVETHVIPLHRSIVHERKDALGLRTFLRFRDGCRLFRFARRIARFVRDNGIEVLHANSLKADIVAALAGKMANVPVIWHLRDRIASDYLPSHVATAFRLLGRVLPDYVIANSVATLETLGPGAVGTAIPSGIEMGQRRQVVHDGLTRISTETFSNEVRERREMRIGLIGRISPWKGQHVFIRAAVQVLRAFPQARFVTVGTPMFGEGEYEKQLHELVHKLKVSGCVDFLGFSDDVPSVIDGLDVVVHASTLPEPFGQVVIEAMASAKPIVATRGGGVSEIVDDGVNGLLVPMGDDRAMSQAICRLLSDPDEAREMGRRGRLKVLRQFTIDKTVRQVQKVYDFLIDTRYRVVPSAKCLPANLTN